MTTFEFVDRSLDWHESGRPEITVRLIAKVKVAAIGVDRRVVVAIARDSSQPRVAIKRVSSARLRKKRKELFAAPNS